ASLKDSSERPLDVWLSTPDKPANPQHARSQANTVCLIARVPLKPDTTYTVHVAARTDGQRWERAWSFTTLDSRPAQDEVAGAVARINAYRRVAGVRPVALDGELFRGCAAHARYIALNFDPRNPQRLNLRDEDPRLPGYSDQGRAAAQLPSVRFDRSLLAAIDSMMASFDRAALEPSLRKVGLGCAPAATQKFVVSVIDLYSDRGMTAKLGPVVLFPADGQVDVPLIYPAPEWHLLHPEGDGDTPAGYAITATFPWEASVTGVTAKLKDGAGKEVEFWLSTPEKPALRGRPQNMICLIPKAPLQPAAAYMVTLAARVRGKPWKQTWSFRTREHPELTKEQIEVKVLVAVNAYRRLAGLQPVTVDADLCRGCLAHARYLVRNTGHPSLQGLGMHMEDDTLPGYTPEGQKAGKGSVITNDGTPGDSVAGWMATLYHRLPLLNPRLRTIGFGYARLPDQQWMSVMDLRSGLARD
ncbi:MAG TPA: CAP domain-containing protein, partial [Gemmataceae bacterium]|nr:CAP domain-containing protein [Gemmataceae bacterium]